MKIVVVCMAASAAELIRKALSLGGSGSVTALCEAGDAQAGVYAACGAESVVKIPDGADDCALGTQVADALNRLQPDAVLFPATIRGRFISAWAAAKLQTGLTADCTELAMTAEGALLQTRPAFGGNLLAQILCPTSRPQMASVRPGVFPPAEPQGNPARVPALVMPVSRAPARLERLHFEPSDGGVPLQNAKIMIAGGRGIGGKSGFETLHELAGLMGGVVAATRSAVDAGWIPYPHQVGQTGVTVRPNLYLAFGISGAVQHIVGMNGAGTVIAVNTDRSAPIFDHANYGIVADWRETAEAMIRYLKERKSVS